MSNTEFSDIVKSLNKRFVIMPVSINTYKTELGHLNMIIIDNQKKTIERFETNKKGLERKHGNSIYNKLDKKLDKLISGNKYYQSEKLHPCDMMVEDIEELNLKLGIKTSKQSTDAYSFCATMIISIL